MNEDDDYEINPLMQGNEITSFNFHDDPDHQRDEQISGGGSPDMMGNFTLGGIIP